MLDPAPMTFTLEDYDRLVDGRDDDRRFELVDGQIFAFAGAMPVHNALMFQMAALLDGDLLTPLVIVEILSPATRDYDLVRKGRLYATIPSLANYVFVDTAARRTTVVTRERDAWFSENAASGESFTVANARFRCEAAVDALYRSLDVPAV